MPWHVKAQLQDLEASDSEVILACRIGTIGCTLARELHRYFHLADGFSLAKGAAALFDVSSSKNLDNTAKYATAWL